MNICQVCILHPRETEDLRFTLDGKERRVCKKCWKDFCEKWKSHLGAEPTPGVNLDKLKENT